MFVTNLLSRNLFHIWLDYYSYKTNSSDVSCAPTISKLADIKRLCSKLAGKMNENRSNSNRDRLRPGQPRHVLRLIFEIRIRFSGPKIKKKRSVLKYYLGPALPLVRR